MKSTKGAAMSDHIIIVRDGDGDITGIVRPLSGFDGTDAAGAVADGTVEILKADIPDKSWTYEVFNVETLDEFLESLVGAFQS
jgi:hypothetical protein